MALVDLKSDLTWYGTVPPGIINYSLHNSEIENDTSFKDEYNKFKVRDEAYNATGYFRQPFILRGIQRDNKDKPQRWGIANFDDGLMRGGIVTATERSLIDTVRIGKFLAKPRGISFLIKQFGLQLSNPNVESGLGIASLPVAQSTKWFTPINLLANTASSAFGLHFKRHGLFPIGGTMSYTDNVVKLRPNDFTKTNFNRLVNLKKELFKEGIGTSGLVGKLTGFAQDFLGVPGTPIMTLTGVTGPGSIYGLGITTMRRTEDTSLWKQLPLLPNGNNFGLGTYGNYITNIQYTGDNATNLRDRYLARGTSDPNVASIAEELWSRAKKFDQHTQFKLYNTPRTVTTPDNQQVLFIGTFTKQPITFQKYIGTIQYPMVKGALQYLQENGSSIPIGTADEEYEWQNDKKSGQSFIAYSEGWEPDDALANNLLNNQATTIQKYSAVAYGNIPKLTAGSIVPNDFRKDGVFQANGTTPFIGNPTDANGNADYTNNNLNKKYKIGNPGDPGKNRSDWTNNTPTGRGDSGVDGVNNLPFNATVTQQKNNPDLIRFKLETSKHQAIIFRSFISSLTDSFNPSIKEQRLFGFGETNATFNLIARQISMTLIVAAQSRKEMANLWNKLDKLAQMCYPLKNGGINYLQTARLTLGNMYYRKKGYLASLTYDWDTETPWDLDFKVPMYTTVDLMFEVKTGEDKIHADYNVYKAFNGLTNITF